MAESRVDILLRLKSQLEGSDGAMNFLRQLTGGLTAVGLAYKAVSIARDSVRLADEIKALAAEANLTTDAFQVLKVGGMDYAVTQETIVRGAVSLRKNLEEAAKNGAHSLNRELAHLKLTAAGLQSLAPERQFEVLGRAILNATDKEQAFNAALELMGSKNAPKLLELLKSLGGEGFDKLAKSAAAITLTKAELDTLEKAADAWERIGYALKVAGARATNATIEAATPAMSPIAAADQKVKDIENQPRPSGGSFALGLRILQLNKARADFVREAAKVADPMNLAAAEETLGRMAKAGAAPAVIESLRKQLATARVIAREELAKQAALAETQNKKMAAAESAATFSDAAIDKRTAARVKEQREAGKDLIADVKARVSAASEENARLGAEADRFRNLADPMREYRVQLERIQELKTLTILTDEEAAAATKAVTQAMMEASGEIGAHTRKLSELAEQRQLIEGNPFLSVAQKQSQLGLILQAENRELDRQIRLLREKTQLAPDEARQLDGLVKRRTSNEFDPAGMSFGQQVGAGVMNFSNSFGTQAQQTAGLITNTIGRSVDAVGQGIAGWMTGTTTWGQVMQQLGTGVLSEIINFGLRVGAQMLINATIGKALQASTIATTLTTTAATAAGISALMIGPATLATIASFGAAAVQAPLAILAAKAAAAPLGLFYQGGHTGPGGIVHADEWVAPNWMVEHPHFGGVIDSLESARTGTSVVPPASASAAGGAFAGKRERTIVIVENMNRARALERDPEWNSVIVRAGQNNRGEALT